MWWLIVDNVDGSYEKYKISAQYLLCQKNSRTWGVNITIITEKDCSRPIVVSTSPTSFLSLACRFIERNLIFKLLQKEI